MIRSTVSLRLLLLPLALPAASAQVPAPPGRVVPRPQEFLGGQDDNLFSLPRSQEEIHAWEQALDDLKRDRPAAAVERLHRVLQKEIGGIAPVDPGRFMGLRLCAILTLANLPPAAAEAYEALVRREAGSLLSQPLEQLDPPRLRILAERFPSSDAGRAARMRLGDLALEAGDGIAAAAHFRALLDAVPIGSALERAASDRLLAAAIVLRPRDHRGAGADPPAAGDVLAVMPPETDDPGWLAFGGGGGGRTPMHEPVGTPRSYWTVEVNPLGFETDAGMVAMHPVGDLTTVFVNSGVRLQAFDPLRKALLWASPVPLEQQGDLAVVQSHYEGALNQDMILSAACGGDVVVAALQVPENSDNVEFRGTFRIMSKIPERRLFAFHRTTGKLLWSHFDRLGGPVAGRFRGHAACGPPLVVGDTVYAPVHDRSGAIAFYVGAYDLETGAPRWRRLICSSQQEVNMFGNARSEFAASPLCVEDGVLYGSANLGVAYAVEQATGRLRWVHAYEVTPLPMSQLHGQSNRLIYFANNAPVVADGVVALTPLDSMFALGIDTETGRGVWRLSYAAKANGNNDVRWLLGAAGGEFVFAGRGVVAVRARPDPARGPADPGADVRQVQRPEYLQGDGAGRSAQSRPALTREFVYFPLAGRLSIFDLRGNMAPHSGELRLLQPGNLLLVDGMLVCTRYGLLDFQCDPEALLLHAEARLRGAEDDPAALLRLAMLRTALLGEKPDPAAEVALEELFRRGLRAAERQGLPPSHPLRQEIARELFAAALARAEAVPKGKAGDAAQALRAARDLAPDAESWIRAQIALLSVLEGDAMFQELERLAERHGSERFPFAEGSLPVRAWTEWRRATLLRDPAAAVAAWQELFERHPEERIGGRNCGELAHEAIAARIEQAGAAVYAAVEARAKNQLDRAGSDAGRLRAVAARFPHSAAAAAARGRLLDIAVERGDLGAVAELLTHALASGGPAPALLRRAVAAAQQAGNRALALCLAQRLLREAAGQASDFAPDGGRPYGEVIASLRPALEARAPVIAAELPEQVLAEVQPMAPHAGFKLLRVLEPPGFDAPAAPPPVYVVHLEHLQALDPARGQPEPLFQVRVEFLESLLLCGRVLVVPDLQRVAACDYRTGESLWELENPAKRLYECLGIQGGVLHLAAQANSTDAEIEVLGLEPLTGRVLFRRWLPPDRFPSLPKAAARQLLLLETPPGADPVLHRLDPVSGRALATVPLAEAARAMGLRPDVVATRQFPQVLEADAERVYLPLDGPQTDGAPALAAVAEDGTLAWTWRGTRGRRLLMAGLRGDRLCLVEAGARGGGKVLVLRTADGTVARESQLEESVQVLNWQRGWLAEPAPPLLLVIDKAPGRRLTAIALDDELPSFQHALSADVGEGIARPVLGPAFLTFAMRPVQRGPVRLYSLRLADRRGALPDDRSHAALPLHPPYGVTQSGPYTVISSAEGLTVFGGSRNPR